MSKSAMLRTRRRDVNVKPNRRLDRKSSRGMIYENEELRLRTININAEIERGQSDIKKLRKENEQLRKEIWCLRDEYDKLDRLLKEKQDCTSSSDSESCTSCSESEDPETTQNIENVQKTTLNSLRNDFDHLSVVTEETSAENSDKNSQNSGVQGAKDPNWEALPPDMGYPQFEGPKNMKLFNTTQNLHLNGGRLLLPHLPQLGGPHQGPFLGGQTRTLPLPTGINSSSSQCPRHFFSPLKSSKSEDTLGPPVGAAIAAYKPWSPLLNAPSGVLTTFTCAPTTIPTITAPQTHLPTLIEAPIGNYKNLIPIQKSAPDILIQSNPDETSSNSFVNGGNLDELLQDIDNISQDILKISSNNTNEGKPQTNNGNVEGRPFKSEISVVLMPQPMPLLGFEKYGAGKSSLESVADVGPPFGGPNWGEAEISNIQEIQDIKGSFTPLPEFPLVGGLPGLETTEIGEVGEGGNVGGAAPHNKTDPNPFFFGNLNENKTTSDTLKKSDDGGTPPTKRTRKLSIYFKGHKKLERSLSLDTNHPQKDEKQEAPLLGSQKTDPKDSDNQKSSDSKTSYDKKHRKSSSTSPERRHVHIQDTHKKSHKKRQRKLNRRTSLSLDKFQRDHRSISVCTDRSNILEHRQGLDEFLTNSERDRSNSLSSCDTIKSRKTSQIPQLPVSGKIPWFGCWGNGCL